MNQTRRLIILGVALLFAAGAALLVGSFMEKPKVVQAPVQQTETVDVLVAKREIRLGDRLTPADLRWQAWPKEAASQGFITRAKRPKGIEEFDKAIAKTGLLAGEPISEPKLVRCTDDVNKRQTCEGGSMAAILPAGMRAISTKISEETSAGRFILPNDMVDLILTRRMRSRNGNSEDFVSDTLLQSVRVLAIGQLIESKDGKKVAEGATATLELTPGQAEQLALAKSMGEISLSLRSIADLRGDGGPIGKEKIGEKKSGNGIKLLKYGVGSRAFGVN